MKRLLILVMTIVSSSAFAADPATKTVTVCFEIGKYMGSEGFAPIYMQNDRSSIGTGGYIYCDSDGSYLQSPASGMWDKVTDLFQLHIEKEAECKKVVESMLKNRNHGFVLEFDSKSGFVSEVKRDAGVVCNPTTQLEL